MNGKTNKWKHGIIWLITFSMMMVLGLAAAGIAIASTVLGTIDPELYDEGIISGNAGLTVSIRDTGDGVDAVCLYLYYSGDYETGDFTSGDEVGPIDISCDDLIDGTATHSTIECIFNGDILEHRHITDGSTVSTDLGDLAWSARTGSYIFKVVEDGNESNVLGYSDVMHMAVDALDVDAGTDQTILPGSGGATLTATASGGLGTYSFAWKDDANNPVGSGDTVSVDPSDDTTYTVTVTDQMGNDTSDTVTVDVDICGFSPVTVNGTLMTSTLSMDSDPSYYSQYKTYLLKGDDVGSVKIGDTQADLPSSVSIVKGFSDGTKPPDGRVYEYDLTNPYEANKYRYALGGRDSGSYKAVALSDVLTVEALSVDAGADQAITYGDTVTLTATPTGGYGTIGYEWTPGGATSASIDVTPAADTTYTVKVTDGLGIEAADSVDVDVTYHPIVPILEKIIKNLDKTFTAHFGYGNDNHADVSIDVGDDNKFSPGAADQGQPTDFTMGGASDAFSVGFASGDLTWTLDGSTVTASSTANDSKTLCEVQLTLLRGAGQIEYSYEDMYGNPVTGTTSSMPESIYVPYGKDLTLTPVPDRMYLFDQWRGNVPAAKRQDVPLVLTVKNPRDIRVRFKSPDEVWVNENFSASDADGHIWDHDAFDNVDDGIEAVADGGTVYIADGTYDLRQQYILIDKTITIDGNGAGTVITNPQAGQHGFFINAPDVTVKELKFYQLGNTGQGTAIDVGNSVRTSDPDYRNYNGAGLTVEDVIFENVGNGVYVMGVYADSAGKPVGAPRWRVVKNVEYATGITVKDCTFTGIHAKGMYFEKGDQVTIDNCQFTNVGLTYGTGAAIDVNLKNGDYTDWEITNNTFDNCGNPGVVNSFAVGVKQRGSGGDPGNGGGYARRPATLNGVTIEKNTFVNNQNNDLIFGEPNLNPGEYLALCDNVTVTGNAFGSSIENYCAETPMLLLIYGDNTGIDDRAKRIENPGYIKFVFTVSYDSQGGSAIPDATAIEDFVLSRPGTPSKTGHHFAGWYKERGCVNLWSFANDLVKTNMTLYAKWDINRYTVRFDSQGGSAVGSVTADFDTHIAKPGDPVRDGYTFEGWHMDNGVTWYFNSNKVRSDMTLYAEWTQIPAQTRLFSFGGAATPSPSPAPSPTPEPTPAPTPEVIVDETPPAGGQTPGTEELGDDDVPAGGSDVKGGGSIFASWWFWLLAAGGAGALLLALLWILGKRKGQTQH